MEQNPTHRRDGFAEGFKKLLAIAEREVPRPDRPSTLPLEAIRMAPDVFQPRTFEGPEGGLGDTQRTNAAHVEELVRSLKAKGRGGRLDDVLVVAIGQHFYCIDGHHRLAAYLRAGIDEMIPVKPFEGTVVEAVKEAIKCNAKDRLPMDHADKMEAAWRLVGLGDLCSKAETAEATGASESTIGNMRATFRQLDAAGHEPRTMTWSEAKQTLKGDVAKEFDDDARAAQTREWAKRFGKAFGKKARRLPEVFGDAIELYSDDLPRLLVEHWGELAREVAEILIEEDRDMENGTPF